MVRRRLASNVYAARACFAYQLQRIARREVCEVPTLTTLCRDEEIAGDDSILGFAVRDKNARNPTCAQCGGAQYAGVRHGIAVVRKAHGAGSRQRCKVAWLAPFAANGDRADWINAAAPEILDALGQPVQRRGSIERRIRVRHAGNAAEPSTHRSLRSGSDRLLVRKAGFAQVNVHVDETGCDHRAHDIQHGFAFTGFEVLADLRDDSVADPHVANGIERRNGIDDSAARDEKTRH